MVSPLGSASQRSHRAYRLGRQARPHIATYGTSPLTEKARDQKRGTNTMSFTSLLETQHPKALGLKEPNILGIASEQTQLLKQYNKYLIVEGIRSQRLWSTGSRLLLSL